MYAFNRYKAIRIRRAIFHCNRLTTVQDIQDRGSLFRTQYISIFYCRPELRWAQVVEINRCK